MTKTIKRIDSLFSMGRIAVTRTVREHLSQNEILSALSRHASGDWGVVNQEDWQANEHALLEDCRLFSAYETEDGKRFWVITEADRSATTVLFPSDY
jgi:hypothetical protein